MQLEIITQHPDQPNHHPPILFVHGAWHGAWCWERYFMPYFTQHGFTTHALSLRGHGGSPNSGLMLFTSVWDYVHDVVQAAQQIKAERGVHPILIGHSMGGYITQKYLELHSVPAAVLVASIPVTGLRRFDVMMTQKYPMQVLESFLIFSMYPHVRNTRLVRAHFFSSDVPEAEIQQYQALMGNESVRVNLEATLLDLPKPDKVNRTPMLVVAGEHDALFTLEEEKETARAYGADFRSFPMAHNMMLEPNWQTVADHIIQWFDSKAFIT